MKILTAYILIILTTSVYAMGSEETFLSQGKATAAQPNSVNIAKENAIMNAEDLCQSEVSRTSTWLISTGTDFFPAQRCSYCHIGPLSVTYIMATADFICIEN